MILSKTAIVKWNSRNKRRYESLGYNFTKMNDEFEVPIEELSPGSCALIKFRCDYCKKEYTQEWRTYNRLKNNSIVAKHCCGDAVCTGKKSAEVLTEKYGVSNAAYILSSVSKREQINMERYGSKNVFSSEEIKKKIVDSYYKIYGVDHPMKSSVIKEKVRNTRLDKYGVPYYLGLNYGSNNLIGDKNPRWNPNKTVEERIYERRTYEYAQWRQTVFNRDSFVCVKCGSKGVKYGNGCKSNGLNAHHIKNYASNEAIRFDVDNGITLCNKCHTAFHKQYGYFDNNNNQLLEFLNYDKNIC